MLNPSKSARMLKKPVKLNDEVFTRIAGGMNEQFKLSHTDFRIVAV
jgi:hypothetical protein